MANELDAALWPTGESHTGHDDGIAQASVEELKNALYARCANQPADKYFDQHDLLGFGIIPNDDASLLHTCTHQLTRKGLLKVHKRAGGVCWKVVKQEDAAK